MNRSDMKPRGFAKMTLERRKEIASMGGKAAHEKGTAHQWTVEGARAAGHKGGKARAERRYGTSGRTGGTSATRPTSRGEDN